jgi:biopolymer transport protein TolR
MGMSGGGGRGQPVAEINVTPLVDVMLVLLIIFMITAPMLNNAGIDVDLPKEEAPPLDSVEDQLVLGIDKDLRFFLNETETPRADLPVKLKAIAEANPDAPVFLKADAEVPYREVAWVLASCKKAGMPRLGFVFEPGAGP